MPIPLIIVILLILVFIGGIGPWGGTTRWYGTGYYGGGGLGLVVLVLLILLLTGRL